MVLRGEVANLTVSGLGSRSVALGVVILRISLMLRVDSFSSMIQIYKQYKMNVLIITRVIGE